MLGNVGAALGLASGKAAREQAAWHMRRVSCCVRRAADFGGERNFAQLPNMVTLGKASNK